MDPRSRARTIATSMLEAAVGGVTMLTLMACYGAPICESEVDLDKDGYFVCPKGDGVPRGHVDCDDTNPLVHPFAQDPLGDGIDQDCDRKDGAATGNATGMPAPSTSTPVGSGAPLDGSATPAAVPSGSQRP